MTEVVDNNCHCQELIVNSREGLVCFFVFIYLVRIFFLWRF